MPRIYLDNAATSFPKPPQVTDAMVRYAQTIGAPARGVYAEVKQAQALVDDCRRALAKLIGGSSPKHVIFTLNTTDAMNLAIHGLVGHALAKLQPGQQIHLITSDLDHNSALRPFNTLLARYPNQIALTRIPLDPRTGLLAPAAFERAIQPNTLLVATLHASNVTGAIQPIAEIGAICKRRNVLFLLDAAQSLGHIPVDIDSMGVDLVAIPGHKGLLGPTGTGALYIRPGVEDRMTTVREGGTGYRSELEEMPSFLPDRFEPGSHNTIGIIGLGAALNWIDSQGLAHLRTHELGLIRRTLAGLTGPDAPKGLHLLGPREAEARVAVFSVTCNHLTPAALGLALEQRFGILTRSGLHCAPAAHASYGTLSPNHTSPASPTSIGATRFSYGPFTTEADVDAILHALRTLCAENATPLVPEHATKHASARAATTPTVVASHSAPVAAH